MISSGQDCDVNPNEHHRSRDFRFPRREKLKGRDEIREVFNRKKAVACRGAKLFTRPNGLPYNRIAFTFSRKFGNAVERNHSRRLSREVYRILRNELLQGYDIVLLVHNGDSGSRNDFISRMEQLRILFSRAGLSAPNTPVAGIQERF